MPPRSLSLTAEQRADILDSLRAGCAYPVACGTKARWAASQALEAADADWRAQVAIAREAGIRERAVAIAEAASGNDPAVGDSGGGEANRVRVGGARLSPSAGGPPESDSALQRLGGRVRAADVAEGNRRGAAGAPASPAEADGATGDDGDAMRQRAREEASDDGGGISHIGSIGARVAAPVLPVTQAIAWVPGIGDRFAEAIALSKTLPVLAAAPAPMAYQPLTNAAPALSDAWARRLEEAAALAPGYFGYLLWVERKCVDGGLHAMDPQWLWHFEQFYASGKFLDVGRFGLRAAKSDSTIRALAAEVYFIQRKLEPNIAGVCPIMSSNMREAGDRFETLKGVLRACGTRELEPRDKDTSGGFRSMGGGNTALVIELQDSQGHPVEYRIYPASEAGAAGFTGIAGFGDELDLWGKAGGANPASRVVRILLTRYTTQPEARLHLMSATYDRASYHAAMIDGGVIDGKEVKGGDTALRRVARLGAAGAAKDLADRTRLAALHGLTDPMLLAPSDPESCDIPSWVSNPVAPIEDCYAKSDGDLRAMFSLYGARPELAGKGTAWTIEMAEALGRANRAIVDGGRGPDGEDRFPMALRRNTGGDDGL